jgi:UDP-glucose 4-epimerase
MGADGGNYGLFYFTHGIFLFVGHWPNGLIKTENPGASAGAKKINRRSFSDIRYICYPLSTYHEIFFFMPTFLVTGGAGFIGSHIAEALVARGDQVRVLDNLSTGHLANMAGFIDRIEFIQADLLAASAVARAVRGVDCVFHHAALASVPLSIERPLDVHSACATGTLILLNEARSAGVRRVVYAASSSAYGNQPGAVKSETDLPASLSPYAAAKLTGELYCQAFTAAYGLETVALRYFNIFGPRQDPNSPYSAVIPLFIKALLGGCRPVIYGDGRQSRDFCFVSNVVQANLLAADAPKIAGRVFNIANGKSTDLMTLLEILNRLLGMNVKPVHEPPRPGDVRESRADISQARRYLDYQPEIDLEEGLRRSIEHYKQCK